MDGVMLSAQTQLAKLAKHQISCARTKFYFIRSLACSLIRPQANTHTQIVCEQSPLKK